VVYRHSRSATLSALTLSVDAFANDGLWHQVMLEASDSLTQVCTTQWNVLIAIQFCQCCSSVRVGVWGLLCECVSVGYGAAFFCSNNVSTHSKVHSLSANRV